MMTGGAVVVIWAIMGVMMPSMTTGSHQEGRSLTGLRRPRRRHLQRAGRLRASGPSRPFQPPFRMLGTLARTGARCPLGDLRLGRRRRQGAGHGLRTGRHDHRGGRRHAVRGVRGRARPDGRHLQRHRPHRLTPSWVRNMSPAANEHDRDGQTREVTDDVVVALLGAGPGRRGASLPTVTASQSCDTRYPHRSGRWPCRRLWVPPPRITEVICAWDGCACAVSGGRSEAVSGRRGGCGRSLAGPAVGRLLYAWGNLSPARPAAG
jgi:hypothetical protein